MSELSRRNFLKKSGMALAGMMVAPTIVPPSVFGKAAGYTAPSDKLNILGVGVGGRGAADLRGMETENIIGLCDCDWKYAKGVFDRYPNAKKYSDYRKMYDEMLKDADAVMVATADHTHAIIAADAIVNGKHVYVEKPMTLYPYESRLLTKLAKKHKVATQMGNQGASSSGTRKAINWLRNGEIGEVTRIESYTNRPIWPQGMAAPKEVMKVPKTMDWEAFIGPAKFRPYNSAYTPWNFRGWWDFGSGALGDMANHILQVPFRGLELGYPEAVIGSSTMLMSDACPSAQKITYRFPARDNMPKLGLPGCELTWYDGGLMPNLPLDMPEGKSFDGNGVSVLYGTKDTMVVGTYGYDPFLCSGREPEVPQLCRVVPNDHHQQDWIRACKESPENRVPCESDFAYAGPLNEMITMGVAAVRLQGLNQWLDWDGENMVFTNIPENATVRDVIEDKFSINEGHPTFDRTYTDPVNAREFAARLIKPVYRDGWTLPEMPQV
ncbi:MAG: Gfo/Idh/MocA family oxidoreductase [Muribaculaceae bacterium]|nr:Gfo/Idh/MocA family oxidoreductase [Muribaculaceae bacterium]